MLLSLQRKPMRLDLIGLTVPDLEAVGLSPQRARHRSNARETWKPGTLLDIRSAITSALNTNISLTIA
jgi:hypothetical protein